MVENYFPVDSTVSALDGMCRYLRLEEDFRADDRRELDNKDDVVLTDEEEEDVVEAEEEDRW